jgi:hypothetical protein
VSVLCGASEIARGLQFGEERRTVAWPWPWPVASEERERGGERSALRVAMAFQGRLSPVGTPSIKPVPEDFL